MTIMDARPAAAEIAVKAEPTGGIWILDHRGVGPVITWHKDNPDEVAAAAKTFADYRAAGCLLAEADSPDSTVGEHALAFNPAASVITVVSPMAGG